MTTRLDRIESIINTTYTPMDLSDLDALIAVARAAQPLLQLVDLLNKELGPCDHSVGICQCADLRTADVMRDTLAPLLEEV